MPLKDIVAQQYEYEQDYRYDCRIGIFRGDLVYTRYCSELVLSNSLTKLCFQIEMDADPFLVMASNRLKPGDI